jgi:chromosome partitioning protein
MQTRIISLVNHKGGVGKTTTTLNLGKALSLCGKRVLLIDIDPQANLSISVNIREPKQSIYHSLCEDKKLIIQNIAPQLDLVPADLKLSEAEAKLISGVGGYFKLKKALAPVAQNYDFVLIDCPPSLGILTMNAIIASSEVLIIVQSQFLSVEGLDTILTLLKDLGENLQLNWKITGMLLTQTNRTVVSKDITSGLRDTYAEKVLQTTIRQNVALVESSGMRQDIFTYASHSTGAEDYMNLAKEIL